MTITKWLYISHY